MSRKREDGEVKLQAARITPEMAGLPRATLEQFTGGDVKTNAALLYDVLTGIPGARRDIVLLNAAAALVAAGMAGDLKEGVAMGAEAIDSGRPRLRWPNCGSSGRSTQGSSKERGLSLCYSWMRFLYCVDRNPASLGRVWLGPDLAPGQRFQCDRWLRRAR